MVLADKHYEVLEQYFLCWNRTEAYQRVFPKVKRNSAASNAHRLFASPEFQEILSRRLTETVMSADEVLMRLADHARGDVNDFLDANGHFDLDKAREAQKTGLIKKMKARTTTRTFDDEQIETVEVEFELYDAQAALSLLGKNHKLFVERQEVTGKDDGPIKIESVTKPDLSKLGIDELLQLRQIMTKVTDGTADAG